MIQYCKNLWFAFCFHNEWFYLPSEKLLKCWPCQMICLTCIFADTKLVLHVLVFHNSISFYLIFIWLSYLVSHILNIDIVLNLPLMRFVLIPKWISKLLLLLDFDSGQLLNFMSSLVIAWCKDDHP